MSQQTVIGEGAFDGVMRQKINAMFTELYATTGATAAATATYPSTTDGVQTLLAAASVARTVTIAVEATAVFADGTGAQPTFKIGHSSNDDEYAAAALFTDAAASSTFALSGSLPANASIIVTATAATGNGTGALKVTATAIPA